MSEDLVPKTYVGNTIDKQWMQNVHDHGDPDKGFKEVGGETQIVEAPYVPGKSGPKGEVRLAVTKRVRAQGVPLKESGGVAREYIKKVAPELAD